MTGFIYAVLRALAGPDGRLRGWRISAALTLIGAVVAASVIARSEDSDESRTAATVVVLLFCGVGALLGGADWVRRRRAAHRGLPAVDRPAVSRGMRRVLAALAIPCVLAFAGAFGAQLAREWASVSWPAVRGRVVALESVRTYDGYRVTALVGYAVDGRPYSARLSPRGFDVIGKTQADRLARAFAEGTEHAVYHHPSDPRKAALRRGPGLGGLVGTLSLPVLAVIAVALLGGIAAGRPRV